jgi:hypothetical protein
MQQRWLTPLRNALHYKPKNLYDFNGQSPIDKKT